MIENHRAWGQHKAEEYVVKSKPKSNTLCEYLHSVTSKKEQSGGGEMARMQ